MTESVGNDDIPTTVHALIEESATRGVDLQRSDGAFPSGQNGALAERLTPVRATAHWLLTLIKAHEISSNEAFAVAADKAIEFLLDTEFRPNQYTYYARTVQGKDKCNGVIGQAAPIRALAYAGMKLNRPELIEKSREVFSLHPFSKRLGLWERVETDGTLLSYDRTLNHQLIFAAAGATLSSGDGVSELIGVFLRRLKSNIGLHPSGVIRHYVNPSLQDATSVAVDSSRHWKMIWNWIISKYHNYSNNMLKKEIGYLPVNAYALAELRRQFPEHSIWSHDKIETIIQGIKRDSESIEWDTYEQGSMVPYIHLAYALLFLCRDSFQKASDLLKKGIRQHYNSETGLLNKDTADRHGTSVWILVNFPNIELV
ncbi:hypothetical protein EI982_17650 [Haloplanus rallus]|uniref:Agl cluster protein AglQ n=1 Tax=Haloplanus rallus TaxID=1816183 RepID=A0A6B9F9P8_9EURY|nr:hypothetical protein [Haloplanus rallus]QGX96472.1 hypothetical protein EI982_17650 [Haloplanus rallus]